MYFQIFIFKKEGRKYRSVRINKITINLTLQLADKKPKSPIKLVPLIIAPNNILQPNPIWCFFSSSSTHWNISACV